MFVSFSRTSLEDSDRLRQADRAGQRCHCRVRYPVELDSEGKRHLPPDGAEEWYVQ